MSISPLNYYQVNRSSSQTCGGCEQPLASPTSAAPTKALGHKVPNKQYIQEVWTRDQKSKGITKVDDSLALVFHRVVKENPQAMAKRIPKDYFAKCEKICSFFHPECIKKALSHSAECSKCHMTLEPPKDLLSYKDRCIQKIWGIGSAFKKVAIQGAKLVNPTRLKNVLKGGYEGAYKGAQLAAVVGMIQLSGWSENPWQDVGHGMIGGLRAVLNSLGIVCVASGFSALSHMLIHSFELEVLQEAIQEYQNPMIKEKENRLADPAASQTEKLKLKAEIAELQKLVKTHTPSSDYAKARAGMLTVMFVAATYMGYNLPELLPGAALGVLGGASFSTRTIKNFFAQHRELMDKAAAALMKIPAPYLTGLAFVAAAVFMGFSEEGQVIAGGFGAGAGHSFFSEP